MEFPGEIHGWMGPGQFKGGACVKRKGLTWRSLQEVDLQNGLDPVDQNPTAIQMQV